MDPISKQEERANNERFLKLLLANQRRIYALIAMLLPRAVDVDDVMQETLLTMFRKFYDFEQDTDFAAWAFRIARYKVMEHRRKDANRQIQFSTEALDMILSRAEAVIKGTDDRIEALQNCVTRLRKRDRDLIKMRYEQDAKTSGLARHLGEPTDRIYKTMARIHNWLQECVRRTLAEWEVAG